VRVNGVAKPQIWQVCHRRRLHRGHDLTDFSANHRKTKSAVIIPTDKIACSTAFASYEHDAIC
jgi:hypothetical protein